MNKVVIINLGGLVFNMDEQAYTSLQVYLEKLRSKLKNQEGEHEIMEDIEMRLAEIFSSKLSSSKQSISMEDTKEAMLTMGDLDDIEEQNNEGQSTHSSNQTNEKEENVNKRFYRDTDRKIIGGVCSGLGIYFGIDPVLIRLAFIGLFFLGGAALLLYGILLIIIPKAVTSAQKLEMQGKPINVNNIKESFNSEFTELKNNFKLGNIEKSLNGFFTLLFSLIGKVLTSFFKVFGVVILIISIIFIIAFSLGMFSFTNFFTSVPIDFHVSDSLSTTFGTISLYLLIILPIVGLILMISSGIFNNRKKTKPFFAVLWILWASSLITFGIISFNVLKEFDDSDSVENSNILATKSDTLFLESKSNSRKIFRRNGLSSLYNSIKNKNYQNGMISEVSMDIQPSKDSLFHLIVIKSARGNREKDIQKQLEKIDFSYQLQNNKLIIPRGIFYTIKDLYRKEEVELILEVPEEKTVFLSRNMDGIIYNIKNETDTYDGNMLNHYWKMKNGILFCTDKNFSNIKKKSRIYENNDEDTESED